MSTTLDTWLVVSDYALVAAVDWNLRACRTAKERTAEFSGESADVLARDRHAHNVAPLVLLYAHLVIFGPCLKRFFRPEPSIEHSVWRRHVDADTVAAPFQCRHPRQLGKRRFGG